MDVSIVIVNYNTRVLLKQCIESVLAKTEKLEFEIIVVDNGSKDNSVQMLREDLPDVILFETGENLGYGRAANLGAKYAKGNYLFLLNSDTILINNAIKILSDFLDNHPNAAMCGGNLYDELMQPVFSYSRLFPSILYEISALSRGLIERILYGKNTTFNYTGQPLSVAFIPGAIMIRKEVFNSIKGFDPDFFLYHEDVEIAHRVKKMRYTIYNVPDAEIIHLSGASSTNHEKKLKILEQSKKLAFKKTQCSFVYWIIHFMYFFKILFFWLCFSMLPRKYNKKKERERILLKVWINGQSLYRIS